MKSIKKTNRYKKKKTNNLNIVMFFVLFLLAIVIVIVLPTTQTNKFSYGASIPFTPVPAKSNLQLETFTLTPGAQASQPPQQSSPAPTNSNVKQPVANPKQPFNNAPIVNVPVVKLPPIQAVGPTAPPSNGQLCSGGNNSGKSVSGNCYCADLTVTCKNGVGYSASGGLYPGVNPCGTGVAPANGRYCVEKPVIYLYPTEPTLVNVRVVTTGSVVVSDPHYPAGGWRNILADPDGMLHYNGHDYSELFYESSVNTFQKPQKGITIPTNQLSEKLSTLLDQLGLVGHEKQEFLAFWLPRLTTLHSPYVFFSILSPSSKLSIDSVSISPEPETKIAFIAYFTAASSPSEDTLQLPPPPQRKGFVSVEWGGVIGNQ